VERPPANTQAENLSGKTGIVPIAGAEVSITLQMLHAIEME